MYQVMKAQAYRSGELGSFGKARYMLLTQHNFPDTYDERDTLLTVDHDRCILWDPVYASRAIQEHTGWGDMGIGEWVKNAFPDKILAFLKDILKANSEVNWTGYRILGTVNVSNGYPVWSLQLFAKHPKSKTQVYSGHNAPNVEAGSLGPNEYPMWG